MIMKMTRRAGTAVSCFNQEALFHYSTSETLHLVCNLKNSTFYHSIYDKGARVEFQVGRQAMT